MSLNQDDVNKILKLIDESNFEQLSLQIGDLKIFVRKGRGGASLVGSESPFSESSQATRPAHQATSVVVQQTGAGSEHESPPPGSSRAAAAAELLADDRLVPISAPTLGIFYRAPKPDAPPFVEEGDLIIPTDTVCIVEVMKLFNHIKAGVKGRVAKICADDGAMVEHNQILMLIEPENS